MKRNNFILSGLAGLSATILPLGAIASPEYMDISNTLTSKLLEYKTENIIEPNKLFYKLDTRSLDRCLVNSINCFHKENNGLIWHYNKDAIGSLKADNDTISLLDHLSNYGEINLSELKNRQWKRYKTLEIGNVLISKTLENKIREFYNFQNNKYGLINIYFTDKIQDNTGFLLPPPEKLGTLNHKPYNEFAFDFAKESSNIIKINFVSCLHD